MTRTFNFRRLSLCLLVGLLAAAGCRIAAPHGAERKAAVRANAVSNKHIVTESPTLERPAPKVVPGP
jgi:hypothetical protein